MHELRVSAEVFLRLRERVQHAARIARLETAAREPQPGGELSPWSLVGVRAELGQHVVHVCAEVLVRLIAAAVTHQQPLLRQQFV